ncbi:unnamed protein product [Spodoptera littoralis]|uniref:Uncharacterized protein n=1 Tax=Spodoptera littoralis TaxID=7109 RepID=A0A9P0N8J4_SPOLI|nr:unnamed protein product [Spodoptera littoralis]CAH1643716.1 unnamed protein product [Spodoptera littoralis]
MFNHAMNSYLQMECPVDPRVIHKAMRRAMRQKLHSKYENEEESTQPSLNVPNLEVMVATLGFRRSGLDNLIKDLSSNHNLTKQRAVHALLDQVVYPENLLYLIEKNMVHKLIILMTDKEPIVREEVAVIFTRLASTHICKMNILAHPVFLNNIINIIMHDRKEIRYAASLCLKTLTRDRCACKIIMKNDNVIASLLKMIKHDCMEIVIYHLNSLKYLSNWNPVPPLKAEAFPVLTSLLVFNRTRVEQAAMDCLAVLCKHEIGKQLADSYDLNKLLLHYIHVQDVQMINSTLGLLQYTTITVKSKWRVKEFGYKLVKRLVRLTYAQTQPLVQLRAMQVLMNLCDNADMRIEVKNTWGSFAKLVHRVKISPDEVFVNTSEITTFSEETGLNYATMSIEPVDIIKNEYGSDVEIGDPSSYIGRIRNAMRNLVKAMNATSY